MQNWEGKYVFNWNRLSWNEMCCDADNHNVSYMYKRIFKIRTSIKQLLTKYQIFTKLPQISHININRNFSNIIGSF